MPKDMGKKPDVIKRTFPVECEDTALTSRCNKNAGNQMMMEYLDIKKKHGCRNK